MLKYPRFATRIEFFSCWGPETTVVLKLLWPRVANERRVWGLRLVDRCQVPASSQRPHALSTVPKVEGFQVNLGISRHRLDILTIKTLGVFTYLLTEIVLWMENKPIRTFCLFISQNTCLFYFNVYKNYKCKQTFVWVQKSFKTHV